MAQYLADEHYALILQNEEFLKDLRHDQDFMTTLQRDQRSGERRRSSSTEDFSAEDPSRHGRSSKPKASSRPQPPACSSRPFAELPDHMIEGYGGAPEGGRELPHTRDVDPNVRGGASFPNAAASRPTANPASEGYGDSTGQANAFPFTRNVGNDELRRQLDNMSGSTKKKFAAAAKRFFSRRPKSTRRKGSRQLLNEGSAPSTMNLLQDDADFDVGQQGKHTVV